MRKPVTLVLLVGLVLAGCSDDGTDDSGLLGALGRVRATVQTRMAVEYGRPARVRELVDQHGNRYRALVGMGYSSVASYSLTVKDALDLDLGGFDEAILAGAPPKQATVLLGQYDVSAVDGKLRDLHVDGKAGDGGTRWRAADDYEINLEDGPFADVAPLAQFNDIRTGVGSFAFAPAAAGIDWVTEPGDTTLADDDVLGPLARCLGDVVAAQLSSAGQAVAVRDDATEVICLKADRAKVSDALKGDVPSTGKPWDELVPGARVDQYGALARVTIPPRDDQEVGRVLRMMRTADLAWLQ
ncbi:hypothetical protein [Actinophytocola sp.]|uniref:hypothetical protein n=1 Tax=Actinophytocola sp. TaxID=1872138 RepID=UPI003899F1B3